jgi:predicted RNA-binding Zn ribbon-like protein
MLVEKARGDEGSSTNVISLSSKAVKETAIRKRIVVAKALGQIGNTSAIEALVTALEDKAALVWEEARTQLGQVLRRSNDKALREEALVTLKAFEQRAASSPRICQHEWVFVSESRRQDAGHRCINCGIQERYKWYGVREAYAYDECAVCGLRELD